MFETDPCFSTWPAQVVNCRWFHEMLTLLLLLLMLRAAAAAAVASRCCCHEMLTLLLRPAAPAAAVASFPRCGVFLTAYSLGSSAYGFHPPVWKQHLLLELVSPQVPAAVVEPADYAACPVSAARPPSNEAQALPALQ